MNNVLHIDCRPAEKLDWINSARVARQPFAQWVRETLSAATIDTNPPWLHGLSERARICILGAGFTSRETLADAVAEGFDIAALPNAGRRCEKELIEWLR